MTAKPAVDEIRLSRVLLLLALSVFINYLVRGNRGYRRGACIRHIAPSAIGARRRRIGFLSSMLDHFVAVFPGAQTWLCQCEHSCRHGPGASVRHARWRNSDEPIWVAPGFSRGGPY